MTAEARFWDRVEKSGGCWHWTGSTVGKPGLRYGSFYLGSGKTVRAHRYSYELHNGKIEGGLAVCHACDNPLCVNPAHLWLGTIAENNRDCHAKGRNPQWRRTHCRNGHEFTPENTFLTNKGFRSCRICQRAHNQKWGRRVRGPGTGGWRKKKNLLRTNKEPV